MKRRGFTLVELLAVIVILAVLAIIAIPVVNSLIKKSREGALKDSAYGLIDSANYYYANQMLKDSINQAEFDFVNGLQTGTNGAKLDYKGEIKNGKLIVSEGGKIAVCIDNGNNYAYKSVDEKEVTLGEGTCLYDGTTGNFEILSTVATLNKQLKEQKEKYEKEIDDLKAIGDATAADILKDKKALVLGDEVTGTLEIPADVIKKGETFGGVEGTYDPEVRNFVQIYHRSGSSGGSQNYNYKTVSYTFTQEQVDTYKGFIIYVLTVGQPNVSYGGSVIGTLPAGSKKLGTYYIHGTFPAYSDTIDPFYEVIFIPKQTSPFTFTANVRGVYSVPIFGLS